MKVALTLAILNTTTHFTTQRQNWKTGRFLNSQTSTAQPSSVSQQQQRLQDRQTATTLALHLLIYPSSTITMLFLKIVLAFMAYSPLVALAAPHVLPGAGDSNFTISTSQTNDWPPASKLYTGPWTSFPAMADWVDFDAMVSSFRYKTLLRPARSRLWMGPFTIAQEIRLALLTKLVRKQFNANIASMFAAGSTQQDGESKLHCGPQYLSIQAQLVRSSRERLQTAPNPPERRVYEPSGDSISLQTTQARFPFHEDPN